MPRVVGSNGKRKQKTSVWKAVFRWSENSFHSRLSSLCRWQQLPSRGASCGSARRWRGSEWQVSFLGQELASPAAVGGRCFGESTSSSRLALSVITAALASVCVPAHDYYCPYCTFPLTRWSFPICELGSALSTAKRRTSTGTSGNPPSYGSFLRSRGLRRGQVLQLVSHRVRSNREKELRAVYDAGGMLSRICGVARADGYCALGCPCQLIVIDGLR